MYSVETSYLFCLVFRLLIIYVMTVNVLDKIGFMGIYGTPAVIACMTVILIGLELLMMNQCTSVSQLQRIANVAKGVG